MKKELHSSSAWVDEIICREFGGGCFLSFLWFPPKCQRPIEFHSSNFHTCKWGTVCIKCIGGGNTPRERKGKHLRGLTVASHIEERRVGEWTCSRRSFPCHNKHKIRCHIALWGTMPQEAGRLFHTRRQKFCTKMEGHFWNIRTRPSTVKLIV